MNIYAKEGTKVTPVFKDGKAIGGYDSDAKQVEKYLKEGEWYTVDHTDIHNWSTDVYLQEFPNTSFNSVCFVDEDEAKEPAVIPTAVSVEPENKFKQLLLRIIIEDYGLKPEQMPEIINYWHFEKNISGVQVVFTYIGNKELQNNRGIIPMTRILEQQINESI